MEGTAHVIEQLGLAHKAALGVIQQQAQEIEALRAEIAKAQAEVPVPVH
jgi:hypothetical protein